MPTLCSQSRRPDSNRGPLHYSERQGGFQAFAERADRPQNACKSVPAEVYARDAP